MDVVAECLSLSLYYSGHLDLALNHAGRGELAAARDAIRRSGMSPANAEKMIAALRPAGLE